MRLARTEPAEITQEIQMERVDTQGYMEASEHGPRRSIAQCAEIGPALSTPILPTMHRPRCLCRGKIALAGSCRARNAQEFVPARLGADSIIAFEVRTCP